MKVLYFDCFAGISGDMTLGALIDLGIDKELFIKELNKLKIEGYEIKIEKKTKNGIVGTDVNVIMKNDQINEHQIEYNLKKGDKHSYGHVYEQYHRPIHNHIYHPTRNLKDIEEIIENSSLKESIKNLSKKVFNEIAYAEAKVHNLNINEVHFHEVGAIDSIINVVGTSICVDLLGIERVYSSPLHDGKGSVVYQHGILPVPVPTVLEMLSNSGIPLITEDVNTELVTPIGMGLIKTLSCSFGNMPAILIDKIGYGIGKRETGRLNALRVVLGTLFEEENLNEELVLLETNIDDMSAEVLGYTMECLMKNGALDVYYTPIYMKKNRPAVILSVLTEPEQEGKLANIILKETSTLGIRRSKVKRYCMSQNNIKVDTSYGEVRVNVAYKDDYKKIAPEYEDCKKIAEKHNIPLREVYGMVYEASSWLEKYKDLFTI